MRDLVESILTGDNVEASKLFESHMDTILEKKLYEIKRSIEISEVVTPVKGKPGQFKGQNTKADWAKYRKQHPSFGMHDVPSKTGKPKKQKAPEHEKTSSGGLTKKGIEARKKKGYLQAHPALKSLEFIKKVVQYHKTGKIDENKNDLSALGGTSIGQELQKVTGQVAPAKKAGRTGNFQARKTGKVKEKPVAPGTQKGFTAPLTRTPVGTQKGFTAPLKAEPKKPEEDSTTSGMRQVVRQMHRKKADKTKGLMGTALKRVITGKIGSRSASRVDAAKRFGKLVAHKVQQAGKTDTGRVAKGLAKGAAHAWSQSLSRGMTGPLEE